MHLRLIVGTVVISALCACGLDLGGLALIPVGPAPRAETMPDRDASLADAMTGSFSTDPDPVADASGRATAVDADLVTSDVIDDATSSTLAAIDAAADGAAGPCERLAACCPRLLLPALSIPCIVVAMQDAGDVTCETDLTSLVDAGVCP
jgi:hypothetical protein